MNKKAKKWVEALRGGKYEQVMGVLHVKNDGYCCLGVACELYQEEVGGLSIEPLLKGNVWVIHYNSQGQTLPLVVRKWLGLNDAVGSYGDKEALTYDNDHGKTFKEIADTIESEPVGLFVNMEGD